MLTKNLTPFLFGAKLTSRRPPQPEMTVVVRATFAIRPNEPLSVVTGIEQGNLSAELFDEDDEDRRGECVYGGDFADFKLNAEVLVRATCHTPGGKPLTECPVRASVGAWSKVLRVVGPRVFSDTGRGAASSTPLPFSKMPITYANSFGGPGYAKNPAGKGYLTRELPTIEAPGQPARSPADRLEPAGFGPISPAWPQRAEKVGKNYGKAYKATRAPFYADDFDWTYFSAAPADQQLAGYLRGDEDVAFTNMHPDAPSLSARLPGQRVRVFVVDVDRRFREVPMSLDTLFADLNNGTIVLTWRGVEKVREHDLIDVVAALVAAEPLDARPQDERHYQAILEEFERDPTGIAGALSKEDGEIIERAKRERAGEAPPADPEDAGLDPASAIVKRKLGGAMGEAQAAIRKTIADAKEKGGSNADVAGEIAKHARDTSDEPPIAISAKPGALPDLRLRAKVRALMEQIEHLKGVAAEKKVELKGAEGMNDIPNHPSWKDLDPEYTPPGPLPTDEPGPGANLSERDFTGRDLRGADLRGASLRGTIFTRADLDGADLTGADLTGALLFKTNLSNAKLARADLTKVNAAEARFVGADLSRAKLDQAFFEGANLSGARLEQATGQFTVLAKADLTGAFAEGASLERADLSECVLERAHFHGASLVGCLLSKCQARQVDMSEARIHGASFADATLRDARFTKARGDRCSFLRASLDGADFTLASMFGAHFTEASAMGARFYGANLREGRFYRTSLERADLGRSNLFAADLCKAKLAGARFVGASLYGAALTGASGAGVDFMGANLKRSTLERDST